MNKNTKGTPYRLTSVLPYFFAAMGGIALSIGGTVLIQRELNAQAQQACKSDHYRRLVTFRGAAGDTSYCIPAYFMNDSVSHPE